MSAIPSQTYGNGMKLTRLSVLKSTCRFVMELIQWHKGYNTGEDELQRPWGGLKGWPCKYKCYYEQRKLQHGTSKATNIRKMLANYKSRTPSINAQCPSMPIKTLALIQNTSQTAQFWLHFPQCRILITSYNV